jgi:hypothetical protein
MNDDVFLVDLTRDVEAATKVTRAPAKQGRLISLSQAGPYLVARRFGRHDFGSRFARRPIRLGAFPSPSFFDAGFA